MPGRVIALCPSPVKADIRVVAVEVMAARLEGPLPIQETSRCGPVIVAGKA